MNAQHALLIIKPPFRLKCCSFGGSRHPGCTTVHGLGHWVWESYSITKELLTMFETIDDNDKHFFHFCFPNCYLLSDIHNIVVECVFVYNE